MDTTFSVDRETIECRQPLNSKVQEDLGQDKTFPKEFSISNRSY